MSLGACAWLCKLGFGLCIIFFLPPGLHTLWQSIPMCHSNTGLSWDGTPQCTPYGRVSLCAIVTLDFPGMAPAPQCTPYGRVSLCAIVTLPVHGDGAFGLCREVG